MKLLEIIKNIKDRIITDSLLKMFHVCVTVSSRWINFRYSKGFALEGKRSREIKNLREVSECLRVLSTIEVSFN